MVSGQERERDASFDRSAENSRLCAAVTTGGRSEPSQCEETAQIDTDSPFGLIQKNSYRTTSL